MTVRDILKIMDGTNNFCIQGSTEKGEIVQVAHGKVYNIKFPLVPYGDFETTHISVSNDCLYIVLCDKYDFAKINPELTDITSRGFAGYLGPQKI